VSDAPRLALIRRNKVLAQEGRRICPDCEKEYPLTPKHWYFTQGVRVMRSYCKTCANKRAVDYKRRWRARKAWEKIVA